MTILTAEQKLARIAEIDAMFEAATGWGSWMWDASSERAELVKKLKQYDLVEIPHKYERSKECPPRPTQSR